MSLSFVSRSGSSYSRSIGALRRFLFSLLLAMGKMLEELGQASYQLVAAADDVQAAFQLMLFQDFVQAAFQFIHDSTRPVPNTRLTSKLPTSTMQRKSEILMGAIQNLQVAPPVSRSADSLCSLSGNPIF